jgi:prepilin-type N-terminal cleavage/methylation domain-containing protein
MVKFQLNNNFSWPNSITMRIKIATQFMTLNSYASRLLRGSTIIQSVKEVAFSLQNKLRIAGMTLVEVLVALAIVSFVFSSLTQMTFDALKRAKKLELQDKMRNYASEAVEVVYNEKNTNWANFTEIILPASTANVSQAVLYYPPISLASKKTTLKTMSNSQCSFDGEQFIGSCLEAAPKETTALFARTIIRTDAGDPDALAVNEVNLDIVVACMKGKCDPKQFPPFKLNLTIYRTGGSQ